MLSNSVNSQSGVALCTLCGLMCDQSMPIANQCDRLSRWLAAVPSRSRSSVPSDFKKYLKRAHLSADTLIWLDACDVQTTRAAVQLARRVGATVHVGQSTGSHAVKSVIGSDGWLGTTLSELSARAELVVTLGDGILSQAPLLAERFFQSQTRTMQPHWVHISQHDSDVSPFFEASERGSTIAPHEVIRWPRERWFENLTQLALSLQQPSSQSPSAATQTIKNLADRLLAATQTVWLWDVDELYLPSDELIVRRMLSIARTLSERMRCALLPLDLNIGRVTAEETLLWLTGCPTTATWSGDNWYRPSRFSGYSLEQWSSAFSEIIRVSSLASDRSLPNLAADLAIQTSPVKQDYEVQVAEVGRDCSGHLFRGDRGTVLYVQATSFGSLPTAAELLKQLMESTVAS